MRRLLVLVVLVAVAVVVVAVVMSREETENEAALRRVGAPAASACQPAQDVPATGASDHRAGTIEYERTPPNSGPHAPDWVTTPRRIFTVDDAPPAERAVHNLEHGYVVVWYDPSRAGDLGALDDVMSAVQERKVFAMPWTRSVMPSPYVLAAWGHEQHCTAPSGEALADFIGEHAGTKGDAPEPTAP